MIQSGAVSNQTVRIQNGQMNAMIGWCQRCFYYFAHSARIELSGNSFGDKRLKSCKRSPQVKSKLNRPLSRSTHTGMPRTSTYLLPHHLSIIRGMLPLEFHPMPILLRLTANTPATLLLVASHTRSQSDIHSRRRREPEALCHLDQVKLVDVEHTSKTV
jgi:hypothetical protein